MIVVADSNALIGLAKGQVLELLEVLFGDVRIPEAVWHEVVTQGQGRPGAAELTAARGRWLTIVSSPPAVSLPLSLAPADRDVLGLAHSLSADFVLTDDAAARMGAQQLGLQTLHTAEVVLASKRAGKIRSCKQVLDAMRAAGFGIRDDLYERMLKGAGESP